MSESEDAKVVSLQDYRRQKLMEKRAYDDLAMAFLMSFEKINKEIKEELELGFDVSEYPFNSEED